MQTYCTLMGFDFVLEFDWTLTHKGSRPSGLNGPPEYSRSEEHTSELQSH